MRAALHHRAKAACGVGTRAVAVDPHPGGATRHRGAHFDQELSERSTEHLLPRRGLVAVCRVCGEGHVPRERLPRTAPIPLLLKGFGEGAVHHARGAELGGRLKETLSFTPVAPARGELSLPQTNRRLDAHAGLGGAPRGPREGDEGHKRGDDSAIHREAR